MKVSRVGVKSGLSNYLTLTPVVQGQGLLYWKAVGELTHPVSFLSLALRRDQSVLSYLLGVSPGDTGGEGHVRRVICFFCAFLFPELLLP